ncbi:hypothetical protein [Paenibacillus camelliae]|uniref:hypothetical protein n=1 Tax=Paenibacillus camelliae TaxID=512410 RepID=UPI002041561F|nr:hypothetical protein [Paenibacillus camelliae]MCM3632951.1 hypothetical protein [Paenibacillus camelliae]
MNNIFEGVDTSPIDNLFSVVTKTAAIFVLAPCIIAIVISYLFKFSKRTTGFLISLFGLIGILIWLYNIDKINDWLA